MATAAQHVTSLASLNRDVSAWVDEVARLTQPERIHWCDGSEAEYQSLQRELVAKQRVAAAQSSRAFRDAICIARIPRTWRASSTDLRVHPKAAKMPDRTIPGSRPQEAHAKMDALFAGCMKGRTLYVVPYCMGPIDSPFSRCGVEITDSAYVVLNMKLMTRMGRAALDRITRDGKFVKGLAFDRRA